MSENKEPPDFCKDKKGVQIHPFADVSSKAEIGDDVVVGPGAVIGPEVRIGSKNWIGPNVVLEGKVTLGSNNRIFPGACIGLEPQDLKYKGALTEVMIGNGNTIRECVTINRATEENESTRVGDSNLLMAYCHLGHNCEVGNRVVMSNSIQVAGHVVIEDRAVVGGCLGIHQFVHIGYLAMIGGMTRVDRDVPPYSLVEGHPGRLRGLNRVGIKRSGLDVDNQEEYRQLQKVWNLLFKSENVITESLKIAKQDILMNSSLKLCNFVESSIVKGRRGLMPIITHPIQG